MNRVEKIALALMAPTIIGVLFSAIKTSYELIMIIPAEQYPFFAGVGVALVLFTTGIILLVRGV